MTEDAESTFDEEDASGSVTNFTAGSLFDEHVEDAKDSVWLVYIIPDHSHLNYLADTSWNIIKHKMSKFGVNTGVFDCSLDPMYVWFFRFLLFRVFNYKFKLKDNWYIKIMYNEFQGSLYEN